MTIPVPAALPRPASPTTVAALLAVSLGGIAGSLARYALARWQPTLAGRLPWTTLGVNLGGALLLGALVGAVERRPRPLLRAALGTGALGGFTTFSTFELELRGLAAGGRPALALAYAALSLVGGLLAVLLGLRCGRTGARGGPVPG